MASVCCFILLIAGCAVAVAAVFGFVALRHFLVRTISASADWWLVVHVASLSVSLSPTPLPPAIAGNWSVSLSVQNTMRGETFSWDHARVMLLHRGFQRVAETSLERFSVAPGGSVTLETGTVAFALNAGDLAAHAMMMDREDGVMEFGVALLPPDDSLRKWFNCNGLKVGLSSQSQMGSLLNGSPRKCAGALRTLYSAIVRG